MIILSMKFIEMNEDYFKSNQALTQTSSCIVCNNLVIAEISSKTKTSAKHPVVITKTIEDIQTATRLETSGNFDVDTDIKVIKKCHSGFNVTTKVTRSGMLEVTTEGPIGTIETIMTVTPSGNLEIVTEFIDNSQIQVKKITSNKNEKSQVSWNSPETLIGSYINNSDQFKENESEYSSNNIINAVPPLIVLIPANEDFRSQSENNELKDLSESFQSIENVNSNEININNNLIPNENSKNSKLKPCDTDKQQSNTYRDCGFVVTQKAKSQNNCVLSKNAINLNADHKNLSEPSLLQNKNNYKDSGIVNYKPFLKPDLNYNMPNNIDSTEVENANKNILEEVDSHNTMQEEMFSVQSTAAKTLSSTKESYNVVEEKVPEVVPTPLFFSANINTEDAQANENDKKLLNKEVALSYYDNNTPLLPIDTYSNTAEEVVNINSILNKPILQEFNVNVNQDLTKDNTNNTSREESSSQQKQHSDFIELESNEIYVYNILQQAPDEANIINLTDNDTISTEKENIPLVDSSPSNKINKVVSHKDIQYYQVQQQNTPAPLQGTTAKELVFFRYDGEKATEENLTDSGKPFNVPVIQLHSETDDLNEEIEIEISDININENDDVLDRNEKKASIDVNDISLNKKMTSTRNSLESMHMIRSIQSELNEKKEITNMSTAADDKSGTTTTSSSSRPSIDYIVGKNLLSTIIGTEESLVENFISPTQDPLKSIEVSLSLSVTMNEIPSQTSEMILIKPKVTSVASIAINTLMSIYPSLENDEDSKEDFKENQEPENTKQKHKKVKV